MILGLGSDLCNIERIQNSLDRFGERFLNRVFTPVEQAKAARRPFTAAGTLAKRFAAKEAGRLGIKLVVTVGLAGTSGPIAPEYGQQKLVWSETAVTGTRQRWPFPGARRRGWRQLPLRATRP